MIPIEESHAIEQFIIRSTLPIIYEHEGKPQLLGTGTLFEINKRILIITARHLFDDFDKKLKYENISFPESPIKSRLFTLGQFSIFRPDDEHIDIAVLELRNKETILKLKSNWEFLSLNNVSTPSKNGIFFLSGFPGQLTKSTDERLSGKMVTFYTERLMTIPKSAKQPIDEKLDFFFKYEKEVETLEGKITNSPKLQGTSGASVWEYRVSNKNIWTVEDSIRVIGVQSAFIHSQYFRAKSWQAVAESLKTIDSKLSEELTSAL